MDAKALAKSKRAHSLHHSKKSHFHQKPKPPQQAGTSDVGGGNTSKKVKEKPSRPALPSNWDRYDDDLGSEGEDGIGKGPDDAVLPRSKGADFRHLVAEAQSQCQSYNNLDVFPSVEDVFAGTFSYGIGSMLSVRGEGILSWTDNFVLEDEAAGSHEASFLSLNLDALAEQLAKVDISERLFIEPDVLSPELGSKTSSSSPESDQIGTSEIKATAIVSEALALEDFSEKSKNINQTTEVISSKTVDVGNSGNFSFHQGSNVLNQVHIDGNSNQYGKFGQAGAPESLKQISASSVADPPDSEKDSRFEAAAAEAELDMLLNSFSEAKLDHASSFTYVTSPVPEKGPPQVAQNAPSSSKVTSALTNLDDLLDNLLEETSNSLNQNDLQQPWEPDMTCSQKSPSPALQTVSRSEELNDFDSWLDTI